MTVIRRLHVPLQAPEQVIPHLGAPHHWKEGRSAKLLADQWWTSNAIPGPVALILDQAAEWHGAELVDAFVERCTDLRDGRPSPSQSDLLAIVGMQDRLGVVAIEAKVDEGFDKSVTEWLAKPSAGKQKRLAGLCELLGLALSDVGDLRYQLLHRSAAAVYEARRYRARQAAMIVQSWSTDNDGLTDFQCFAARLGCDDLVPGRISPRLAVGGIGLRIAWSCEVAAA